MKLLPALFILAFALMPAAAKAKTNIDACLSKSKEYFNEKEYSLAEKTLNGCLKTNPKNADALISLAGVEMILGKFNNAEKNFIKALSYLNAKSPYKAYIYSRLGDIYMRKANLKEAEKYYKTALKYEPANINALVGAGICEEKTGDINKAVEYYKKALAVDFTNIVSRERLIALEPDILTKEELLRTMKERNIIDPAAQEFSREDMQTLSKMITAEKSNGIEYLSQKYGGKIPNGLIVERDSNKVYVRKMLTITGYNDLLGKLSSDAKQFLINKGVSVADLFTLRDENRKPIFNDMGNLTDEGLTAFTKMLRGEKSYYRPGEKLPATQKEIEMQVRNLISQNYMEITNTEYAALMTRTQCSENTLRNQLKVRYVDIGGGNKRYFVFAHPDALEPISYPYLYVQQYRQERRIANSEAPVYGNSFGLGNGLPAKLCKKDGTLNWDGMPD